MDFEIIPRQVNGDTIQTVSARELHAELEVGRDFSTWIKGRIEQYDFIENIDYVVFPNFGENASDSPIRGNQASGRGGDRRSIEYHVSLDMAKELAMVENNDQGRKARRYFIECERRLKVGSSSVPQIESAKHVFEAVGVAADVLRCSDSSRLAMLHKAASPWPLLQSALPVYAVDAPTDSTTGSSEATAPITEIVQGVTTAAKANKALCHAGLLEQKTRPSTNGTEKAYWSVTEAGLVYGKNITSPSNTRETQPHWYHCKAEEIRKIVLDNLPLI